MRLLIAALAAFPKGLAPMPAPAVPAASCAECHLAEQRAWELSAHATARTDFVFRAAQTEDDPVWCVRCHAPHARLAADRAVPAGAAAEEHGISCVACHVDHGSLAAPTTSELCAGCHQFGFAVRSGGRIVRLSSGEQQQNTYEEWRAWSGRSADARGCADCHMRGGDHSFGGERRYDDLRHSLRVRAAPGALLIDTRDVGHRMPTGDVMRWLSVEVAREPLFEAPLVLARLRRNLAQRRWPDDPEPHLGVALDTTLAPGETRRVPLAGLDPSYRFWRLVYHLVSEEQEARELIPPGISRVVLHAGELSTHGRM